MEISGLHLLLTHRCVLECDHCFVWGSPRHTGAMTLRAVDGILAEAEALGTIDWIYYEGGEPFLCYPVLVRAVQNAAARGFRVGIVTNGYWAADEADARVWLEPLRGHVHDLSVSSDRFHASGGLRGDEAKIVEAAAGALGIPTSTIAVAQPGEDPVEGEARLMYRGRAAARLSGRVTGRRDAALDECPYERLDDPGRVHVDPAGYVHVCQGITIGNLFQTPLREILTSYRPDAHPIVGPLLAGGPTALASALGVPADGDFADACHLCDAVRRAARSSSPEVLGPPPMYGPPEDSVA